MKAKTDKPMTPLVLFTALGLLAGACGILPGGKAVPNDGKPIGTITAQGTFTSLASGKTVTGAAVIYQLTSDMTYVVRLEGLVAPSETNLQVVGEAGGTEPFTQQLRANQGTMNYPTGLGGGSNPLTWTAVYIRSPSNSVTPNYGKATLQAPP